METNISNGEVVLAEVRGLASTMNARFDGVEEIQVDMKAWMGRLSDASDRQSLVFSKFLGFEQRLGYHESMVSDIRLDVDKLSEEMGSIKEEHAKNTLVRNTAVGTLVAGLAAFVTALLTHAGKSIGLS